MPPKYVSSAQKMLDRIFELVPDHPEILQMTSAYQLLQMDGFLGDDINVCLFKAQWALERAKEDLNGY